MQGVRNKTRVVTYRCPGNTACQVYNYVDKTARVIFGPDLVILGPHENFNVLSLSGKSEYIIVLDKCLSIDLHSSQNLQAKIPYKLFFFNIWVLPHKKNWTLGLPGHDFTDAQT